MAHFNRGLAWRSKGELDRAVADLSEAIALEPENAFGYLQRGLAWRAKAKVDRAFDDFDNAIRLDPQLDFAYFNRGLINLYGERGPAKALADFSRASELQPQNAYFALWTDVVRQRLGMPSVLLQTTATTDMRSWPAPVLRMFLGELSPPDLLVAGEDAQSKGIRTALCEAHFYSAVLALRHPKDAQLRRRSQMVADRCPLASVEWYAANYEFHHLHR